MSLHVGAVDGPGRADHPTRSAERIEDISPDLLLTPATEAVVDRRIGTVLGRAITPASSCPEHVDHARDHPPVIYPMGASTPRWKILLDTSLFLTAQPEKRPRHLSPPPNHQTKENH